MILRCRIFIITITFLLSLFLGLGITRAQQPSVEQIAFDYFVDVIYQEEFNTGRRILFNEIVQTRLSVFSYKVCFVDYLSLETDDEKEIQEVSKRLEKRVTNKLRLPNSLQAKKYFKQKGKKKDFGLEVYHFNMVKLFYPFVEIRLFKPHGTTYYYIEMDENESVLRWCKVEVIY